MHIEKLSLFNFKNYEEVSLLFSEKVNCLVGVNGSGKTNILDAIHYLSLTKSAFNNVDSQNIRFGQKFFTIKGNIHRNDKQYEVVCTFQEGAKKSLRLNKKEYDKLSEHIGEFPVVLIAPNDTDIVREGSEIRRRFFDAILSQLDKSYLDNLISYNHYLKQRNSVLKQQASSGRPDKDLLNVYDSPLLQLGEKIYERRRQFLNEFLSIFKKHYAILSDEKELVDIRYRSEWANDNFVESFHNNLNKDIALERTTMGTHRDDFLFVIDGKALKKFGSQGQQKTFLVALKMAHFEVIKNMKGVKPVLLLDDIFDKLDSQRIGQLVKMMSEDTFGQVFITDAREERTASVLKQLNISSSFYHIEKGEVKEASHAKKKEQ